MDEDYGEPVVFYGERNYPEIDRIVRHRLKNFGIVGAFYVDRHIWIPLLEVGKDLGKNVQARSLIRSYRDCAARNVLHLGQRSEHGLARIERLLHVFLKGLACRGQRDFSAGAIKEFGADFVLNGANLGRDGGLGAETLLRRPRK